MEIVEGIYRCEEASGNIAHSNIYFDFNNKEITVIDTGTAGNAKKIVECIQKLGRKPQEVTTIILTHYHMDHAGSVKDLKELTGAKVAAGEVDAEFVSGTKPYPKPKGILMRAASSLIKVAPVPVDLPLKDSDTVGNLKVIFTPGHTPGSIMLLDMQRKVLFTGDTLRLDDGKVAVGPKNFAWDEQKETASIQKISTLDFEVLLPGHGEYLKGGASAAVKAFAESSK